jgi:hypothetical protein
MLVKTVPVVCSLAAVNSEIISTRSTVAELIKISSEFDFISNKLPNASEGEVGTIIILEILGVVLFII